MKREKRSVLNAKPAGGSSARMRELQADTKLLERGDARKHRDARRRAGGVLTVVQGETDHRGRARYQAA